MRDLITVSKCNRNPNITQIFFTGFWQVLARSLRMLDLCVALSGMNHRGIWGEAGVATVHIN